MIDLQKDYGLTQRPLATQDNIETISSLGYDATFVQDRFPNTWNMLSAPNPDGLGWNNTDILNGTYEWFCMQEAALRVLQFQFPNLLSATSRNSIKIPPGRWYLNREVRWSLGVVEGDGSTNDTYANGGTSIYRTDTNWKSLYGAGQGNTKLTFTTWAYAGEDGSMNTLCPFFAPMVVGVGWSHGIVFRQMRFFGTAGTWYDNTKQEAGIMMCSPGEQSAIERCYFERHNDFGVLIDGTPAPFVMYHNSGFLNNVAQIGMRGLGTSNIAIYTQSGDKNPDMIYMFRQGFKGPNGDANYWPYYYDGNPGGIVTLVSPKLEAFCCSNEPGYSTCAIAADEGKGQRLARLTGRFSFTVIGGTLFAHSGKVDSMIRVADDYYDADCGNGSTGIPLTGSSIRAVGIYNKRFKHWMHIGANPLGGDRKWVAYDEVLDPSWNNDNYYGDFYWNAQDPTVARDPMRNVTLTAVTGVWPGRQPYINDTLNNQWQQTTGPTGVFPYVGLNVYDGTQMP